MQSSATIDRILSTIPQRTIGLVGDLFLDRYFDIDAALDEPSIETGLTAYQVTGVRCHPGALGTVLSNLAALGVGRIHPISVLGDDGEGFELHRLLSRKPQVVLDDLVVDSERRTPSYNKPMRNDGGTIRELHRLDIKNRTPTSERLERDILRRIAAAWPSFDAVLVVDQVSEADCGVVTAAVRRAIGELAASSQEKFVLADSRERIGQFRGVCIKPNEREWHGVFDDSGRPVGGRPAFVTLGEAGIDMVAADGSRQRIPGYPVDGPIDICGAGDSCSAGIACAMVSGESEAEAAAFGNLIASITVQQIGVTGTASPEQVRTRWSEVLQRKNGADRSAPFE